MSEQQIKEYLQKYNITSKELLASHIEELKRNTKPNTKLISELVWVLEDFFFSFFERSSCPDEKEGKKWFTSSDFMEVTMNVIPQKSLNNHVSEAINKNSLQKQDGYKVETPFFLDEVISVNEKLETKQLNYESFYQIVYTKPTINSNKFEITYSDIDLEKIKDLSIGDIKEMFNITISAEKTEKEENLVFPKDSEIHKEGIKESNGKTNYSEIDWDIIDLMAKRFNVNKHKYPKNNMLKPIEETELLFAGFRHLRKMMQPIENDEESFLEHLTAVMCNMQMIYQQRKISNG